MYLSKVKVLLSSKMPDFQGAGSARVKGLYWLLSLLSILIFSIQSQAQTDTTTLKIDDQIIETEVKLDSLNNRLDSLISDKETRLDSVQNKVEGVLGSTEKLSNKINHLTDSLSPDHLIHTRKLDSLRNKLTLQIDSLNRLGQPIDKYTRKLDSLQQMGPFKEINKVESKVADLQQKIMEPGNKVGQAINEKLNLMNKEGGSGANLPSQVNIPGIANPELNTPGIPGVSVPDVPNGGINDPMGNMNMPGTDVGSIGGVADPLKDVGSLPQTELGNLTNIDELNTIKQSMGEVGNVTGEIKTYGDEMKNIKEGGIGNMEAAPKALEGKVGELDQVQGMQQEMGSIDEMKEVVESGNDPEAMKKMAVEEAKKRAVDHFASQTEQLKAAMQQVASIKQKYGSVKSIKDLKKHPPNPMKDKPLIERLVPGLILQIQTSDHWLIDFNPVLGYRIGGRVNAGLGWNYRWSVGKGIKTFHEERIYGPRVYGEYKFAKGFAVRADIEKMNAFVPPLGLVTPATEGARAWVWSAFVGLKKEYQFMKKVKGNFQFLYNIYDDHDNSPYADRLIVRTGFEFPQKKKDKKKTKE